MPFILTLQIYNIYIALYEFFNNYFFEKMKKNGGVVILSRCHLVILFLKVRNEFIKYILYIIYYFMA